jgi:uncharacterized membrane protein
VGRNERRELSIMMDRFRRERAPEATTAQRTDTMTEDRRAEELRFEEERAAGTGTAGTEEPRVARERTLDAGTMAAARRRQREEYGGIHWGAAFFGFLAAAGLAAILTGIVSAAGATLTLGSGKSVGDAAKTIGLVGSIAMLVVLVVSYFAGGYVAGRMSRFDGARQGLGVALIVTLVLAAAGALLGGQYNVLEQLNLPRIPVDEGSVATGALIALVVALVGSLVAALAGGKAGERYHRKIDRFAVDR